MNNAEDLKFFAVLGVLSLLVAYSLLSFLRPLLGWLTRISITYTIKWIAWILRITTRLILLVVKHLLLPHTHFYPRIASNKTGSVHQNIKGFRFGGRGDSWATLAVLGVLILQWTPVHAHVYSYLSESEPIAFTASFLEGLVLIAGCSWFVHRAYEHRPFNNQILSNVNIQSSNALNKKSDFLVGRRTDTGVPVYFPKTLFHRNLLVYGAPGFGKTSFAKALLEQQIKNGGGALFVDAKLDAEDVKQVYSFAQAAGREQDMLLINPGNPELSNTYNPILEGDEDEISARCLALVPEAGSMGEDHYREAARQAIKNAVAAMRALGKAYDFRDLAAILGSASIAERFANELVQSIPEHAATADFSFMLDRYRHQGKIDAKRFQEMFSGIAGRLAAFGAGQFGRVTSTYAPEVRLLEAILNNKIIYLSLPTMGKSEAAIQFAKLFVADLRSALASLQALPSDQRPFYMAFLDEAAAYSMESMSTMFAQNRSSGVSLIPLTQTPAQFNNISEDFRNILETGNATKMYFRLGDYDACSHASKTLMEATIPTQSVTHNRSKGVSNDKFSATPQGTEIGGDSLSIAEREDRRALVPPEDFARLGIGEAIIWTGGKDVICIKTKEPTPAPHNTVVRIHRPMLPPTVDGAKYYERFVLNVYCSQNSDQEYEENTLNSLSQQDNWD